MDCRQPAAQRYALHLRELRGTCQAQPSPVGALPQKQAPLTPGAPMASSRARIAKTTKFAGMGWFRLLRFDSIPSAEFLGHREGEAVRPPGLHYRYRPIAGHQ